MAKKPQFELNDLPIADAEMPVTRGDLDPVFQQISQHMEEMKRVVNTQAIILGALMKTMVTKELISKDEVDNAMKEIHDSMQTAQKSMGEVN